MPQITLEHSTHFDATDWRVAVSAACSHRIKPNASTVTITADTVTVTPVARLTKRASSLGPASP